MNARPDLRLVNPDLAAKFERPGSVEAEQALLGAALLHPSAIGIARELLVDDDFGEIIHREIWSAICVAADDGAATPGLVLAQLGTVASTPLPGSGTLQQYVARLAANATTIDNARQYCAIVRDNADRRRLAEAVNGLPQALAADASLAGVVASLISTCDAISSRRSQASVRRVTLEQALTAAIDRTAAAFRNQGAPTGVPTGLAEVDKALGGLQPGDLILLMARPSMGKSALAIAIGTHAAEAGRPVLKHSLEMMADRVASRMQSAAVYSPHSPVPYFAIDNGRIDDDQFARVMAASRKLARLPFIIDPQPRISGPVLAARARRWAQECEAAGLPPGLIIVDYLQIMGSSDRYSGKRNDEVSEISASLKATGKELGVPILALAQMSRDAERRDDKRPQLSDLRDSGSLEQDADVVMGLYRSEYYLSRKAKRSVEEEILLNEERGLLEVSILKQRNGPTGTHKLFFDAGSNFIGEWGSPVRDDQRKYQEELL